MPVGPVVCTVTNPSSFFPTYITPLVTALIALAVGVVSFQQWRVASEKLRLDLYNRRFEVYSRAIDFMQAMVEWVNLAEDERRDTHRLFIKAVRESQFLFASDQSIFVLLEEMNKNGFVVKGFVEHIAPLAESFGSQFKEMYDKKDAALQSIMGAVGLLESKLVPFLAFRQQQSRYARR